MQEEAQPRKRVEVWKCRMHGILFARPALPISSWPIPLPLIHHVITFIALRCDGPFASAIRL